MLLSKLAEAVVRVDTPMFIGGYSGDAVQRVNGVTIVETLRPPTVKGVWRWWATAFAAAAAYSRGYDEVFASNMLLEYVFGGTEIFKQCSPIQIEVEELSRVSYSNLIEVPRDRRLANVPRVKLMTLGGKRYRAIPPGTKYRIIMYVREDYSNNKEFLKFVLSTFVTALTFKGFGKASARGFGSLTLENLRVEPGYRKYFPSLADFSHGKVFGSVSDELVVKSVEELRRVNALNFVSEGLDAAKKLLDEAISKLGGGVASRLQRRYRVDAPVVRAIAKNFYMARIVRFGRVDVYRLLYCINECVYQPNRRGHAPLRKHELTAWVLGLPRRVGKTGYSFTGIRRASPIVFSVHSVNNGVYMTVSAFASADWPQKITWKGGHGSAQIIVDGFNVLINGRRCSLRDLIEEYFDKLSECVKTCLGGGSGKPLDVTC